MYHLLFNDHHTAYGVQQMMKVSFGAHYDMLNSPDHFPGQVWIPNLTPDIVLALYKNNYGYLSIAYPLPNTNQYTYGTITQCLQAYGMLP